MKALLLKGKDEPLVLEQVADPQPAEGQAVVQLKAAALNHRDVFITQGLYPGIQYPVILGSDGAGTVEGREVIISPGKNWGDDPRCQSKAYQILGLPENGAFAEQVAVDRSQLVDKPAHLSWEEAAALPLAGLTAFRALFTRGQLQGGERVLISGAGGGVALFALQFALAADAEVYVTSGSEEKLQKATQIGAKGGVNYRNPDWGKQLKSEAGGFDLVIDSAGGDGFREFLKVINPAGRIVVYGGTQGAINQLSPQILFWKQIDIRGSTMGTPEEFREMAAFVDRCRLRPIVDSVYPISRGQEAFDRMAQGRQFGKIVIDPAA